MSVADLIGDLEARGGQFWVELGQLKFRLPPALLESPELGELRLCKDEAIEFLTKIRNVPVTPPTLEPAPRPARLPVSVTQEKFFELEHGRRRKRDHPALVLSLKGELDRGALQSALDEVVRSNEILRTRYGVDGEGVFQAIEPPAPSPIAYSNLADVDPERRAGVIETLFVEATSGRFDLCSGPVLRCLLIELAHDDHVFIAVVDHIAIDNTSWSAFLSQLLTVYQWRCAGAGFQLPPAYLQYADFAIWENGWLGPRERHVREAFWDMRLGSVAPLAIVPPVMRDLVGSREERIDLDLPASLGPALRELARQEGVTTPLLLVAAFNLALSHWSGQSRLAVGLVLSGRRPGVEHVIGPFLRFGPFLTDASKAESFTGFLKLAKQAYAEANDLRYPHSLAQAERHHLYRVVANIMKAEVAPSGLGLRAGALEVRRLPPPVRTKHVTQEALNLVVTETPASLQGHVAYAAEFFEPATIAWFCAAYAGILQTAVEAPQIGLAELFGRLDAPPAAGPVPLAQTPQAGPVGDPA